MFDYEQKTCLKVFNAFNLHIRQIFAFIKTIRNVKKYSGEAILLSQSATNPEIVDRGVNRGSVAKVQKYSPCWGLRGQPQAKYFGITVSQFGPRLAYQRSE